MPATPELHITEAEYIAALPGRMQEIADQLSECLPEGMRFEWETSPRPLLAGPDVDTEPHHGVHQAVLPQQQHSPVPRSR